jgi:thiamine pyrophosphate-dependent acetolactate synthase large subunit-like protein
MPEGTLTGGMVMSRALARHGVRTVFSLAGASPLPGTGACTG